MDDWRVTGLWRTEDEQRAEIRDLWVHIEQMRARDGDYLGRVHAARAVSALSPIPRRR